MGMSTMTDALVELLFGGQIDATEAYRRAIDKPALVTALRTAGYDLAMTDALVNGETSGRGRPTPVRHASAVTRPTPSWNAALHSRSSPATNGG
jgi:hypothetical protein